MNVELGEANGRVARDGAAAGNSLRLTLAAKIPSVVGKADHH